MFKAKLFDVPSGRVAHLACRMAAGVAAAAVVLTSVVVAGAGPAEAAGTKSVQVSWTVIGIYPRAATAMSSAKVGPALADGAWVTVACETTGETQTNGVGDTNNIWDRLADGTYLPNVYLATGTNSRTPDVPDCNGAASMPTKPNEKPKTVSGDPVGNTGSVAYQLYDHYLWGNGRPVVVDWSYFSSNAGFMSYAKGLKVGASGTYAPAASEDMTWALGHFTVQRTSTNCFFVYDHYDFTPDKIANWPYVVFWGYQLSGAREYDVRASGCV